MTPADGLGYSIGVIAGGLHLDRPLDLLAAVATLMLRVVQSAAG